MRILLAEDDFPSRKFISNHLAKYGDCDITVDGMEATFAYVMALDEGLRYDLVCLDIMMPVLDGIQALKIIRDTDEERNIPTEERPKIFMMTALNDDKSIKKAMEYGCNDYLLKPIDLEKLDALLESFGFTKKEN